MPKSVQIPANVPEEIESRGAPLCVSPPPDDSTPSSPVHFPLVPVPGTLTATALELDTDAKTEASTSLDSVDTDEVRETEISPTLTDLSSFLDVSTLDDEFDASFVTVVDSEAEAYNRVPPTEDVYGWESELNRKVKCGIKNTNVCTCDEFEYRRANGTRRGLLHRVFNSGRRVP